MALTAEKMREQARSRFAYFCRLIQDDEYIDDVHIDLADFLQFKMIAEKPTTRAVVIMPRGSYKTTFATKFFPIWLAIRNHDIRILIVSNTLPNAKQKLSEIRQLIITHPIIGGLFPEIIPVISSTSGNKWSDAAASVKRTATFSEQTFEAAGVRSRLIGRHYDVIIEDDTVAPGHDDMGREVILPSIEDIDKAIGWHRLAVPLMIDGYKSMRLVIGTRWGYGDLLGHIMDNEPTYEVFERKAVHNGKPLVKKFNPEALEDIRVSLGEYMFQTLYLNEAIKPDDMIFRDEWIHTGEIPFNTDQTPKDEIVRWIITVDPAISEKDKACDTAIIRAGHCKGRIYVDQCLAGKFSPEKTIDHIMNLIKLDVDNTAWVGIETVAYQKALALALHDRMVKEMIYKTIQEINTRTNKDVRIHGLQPFFQRGQFILRAGLDKLRSQLLQYPRGRFVDCVDCLAMQLNSYTGVQPVFEGADKDYKTYNSRMTVEDLYTWLKKSKQGSGILKSADHHDYVFAGRN